MLRLALFLILAAMGTYYALQGPFYALLFYLGNAYSRPEDWVWGDFVRSLHLSFIIGSYLLVSTLLSRQKLVWNGRVALLWLFLFFAFVSSISSEHFEYSWPYLVEFAKIILITYLIVNLITDFTKFRLAVLIIVLGLGLEQAKQGWVYLLTSPGGYNNNPIVFLGDNNGTAVGMLMLVPLVGMLIQTSQNKWGKRLFIVVLIGVLYRALSTYSRGGFIAAIAMAGAWWLWSHTKLRIFVAGVIVSVLCLSALPTAFWDRMDTIQTYQEEQDQSALGRIHFWNVAIKMASLNPVLGVGFNSYNSAYDAYDFSGGAYGRERSVHNGFFGVLAELGYVGLFIYAAIIWLAFHACNQVRKLAIRNSDLDHLGFTAVALQASFIAFAVGSSFVPIQYSEMLWHMIGLSAALKQIVRQHQKQMLVIDGQAPQPNPGICNRRSAA